MMSVVVRLLPKVLKACSAHPRVSRDDPQAAMTSAPGGGQESPRRLAQWRKVARLPDNTSP